jgi:hypothetical protein
MLSRADNEAGPDRGPSFDLRAVNLASDLPLVWANDSTHQIINPEWRIDCNSTRCGLYRNRGSRCWEALYRVGDRLIRRDWIAKLCLIPCMDAGLVFDINSHWQLGERARIRAALSISALSLRSC